MMRNQQDFRKTGTNIIGSNQSIASLTAENNKLLSQLNQKKNLLRDLEKRRKRLEREATQLRLKNNQPCPKLNIQMSPIDTVDPFFRHPLNDNFFSDFFSFGDFLRGNHPPLIQNRPRGVIGLEDYGEYVPDEEDDLNEIERQMIQEVSPNPDTMSYEQLLELEDKLGSVSKGLSKDKIRKLPLVSFSKVVFKDDDKCIICQYEFKERERVKQLTCNHIFHIDCIDEWLTKNKTCPMCKSEIKV